jgi:hypothetical protein
MISRSITGSSSPCGANCTYSIQFAGPQLLCDPPKPIGQQAYGILETIPIYVGVWSNPTDDVVIPYVPQKGLDPRSGSTSVATFNITLLNLLGWALRTEATISNTSFLLCRPGQVKYNVNITYLNGIQRFDIETDPESARILTDVTRPVPGRSCGIDETCGCCGSPGCDCGPRAQWSNDSLQWMSDANNMAIIESMTLTLEGQYNVEANITDYKSNSANASVSDLRPVSTLDTDIDYSAFPFFLNDASSASAGPVNGTIIANTALHLNVDAYSSTEGPNLAITEDILNEILQNITLSLMSTFPIWQSEVNATTSQLRNEYSFSNKLNLLLPYYVSLVIALPLIGTGGLSLYRNGVAATDGGFLQILTTTAASRALHEKAVEGALGGDLNVPEELRELRASYGEIVGGKEGVEGVEGVRRRRVGFGVESEVVPIQKGVNYGGVEN